MLKKILFVVNSNQSVHKCEATISILEKRFKLRYFFITDKKTIHSSAKPCVDFLKQIIDEGADIVVFDQKKTDKEMIMKLKELHIKTVNHNKEDPNRTLCDVNIIDSSTDKCESPNHYEGYEYAVLDKEFYKNGIHIRRYANKIIVNTARLDIKNKINKLLRGLNVKITFKKKLCAQTIKQHDISIVMNGYSALQSIATGIPTIIIKEKDQVSFPDNVIVLDFDDKKTSIKQIKKLMACPSKRRTMSFNSRKMISQENLHLVGDIYKRLIEG